MSPSAKVKNSLYFIQCWRKSSRQDMFAKSLAVARVCVWGGGGGGGGRYMRSERLCLYSNL